MAATNFHIPLPVIPLTPSSVSTVNKLVKLTPPPSQVTPGVKPKVTPKSAKSSSAKKPTPSSASTSSTGSKRGRKATPTGFHDMARVETWVCAICKQYDPILEPGTDPENAPTTEWIGCDCNRWYHQHCTKLDKIDDSFSCVQVKLKCLQPL